MEARKADHLKISLNREVESGSSGFEKFKLKHQAAPELDFADISLEIKFFPP